MSTTKVEFASTVAEIPTLHGILKQEEKVNYYKELFLQNLASKNIEAYRKTWAKARAELSRMKMEYHFAGKEVNHV
ncbi:MULTISPECIES: hypothetical protein [Butyricimonas]|uniref:hypothetical protein n=1 Tax=Butyricimonas TaxID=574697 RepID=UPI001D087D50|nr:MULTISPECIES: hypothetical protein [Butyricimonas]MCB6972534.1 hypothetical protein [Butyricimonas synergistica]MCG4519542.1 hypothetical protein [Butyricimonas sp. DFI.6.44]